MSLDPPRLRVFVYDRLIGDGTMPTLADIGAHFGVSSDDARTAVRDARLGKTLLPDQVTGEIWMAGPFAAQPTAYRVRAGDRAWWANCAWDMLGVAALAGAPVAVETQCTDCGDPLPMRLDPRAELHSDLIVHFVVPAHRWYDDIGFT